MPKKAKRNLSQAIRDYEAQNPGSNVKDVVAGLKAKGVEVTDNLVYSVRRKPLKGAAKAGAKTATKKPAPVATKTAPANGSFTASELLQAKSLANDLGGIDRAQEVLGTLKKIL